MVFEKNFGMTDEQWKTWLEKHEDPEGCPACFAIAGCCSLYPNCPGNPMWVPATSGVGSTERPRHSWWKTTVLWIFIMMASVLVGAVLFVTFTFPQ